MLGSSYLRALRSSNAAPSRLRLFLETEGKEAV
jgi:hypothetical protein